MFLNGNMRVGTIRVVAPSQGRNGVIFLNMAADTTTRLPQPDPTGRNTYKTKWVDIAVNEPDYSRMLGLIEQKHGGTKQDDTPGGIKPGTLLNVVARLTDVRDYTNKDGVHELRDSYRLVSYEFVNTPRPQNQNGQGQARQYNQGAPAQQPAPQYTAPAQNYQQPAPAPAPQYQAPQYQAPQYQQAPAQYQAQAPLGFDMPAPNMDPNANFENPFATN